MTKKDKFQEQVVELDRLLRHVSSIIKRRGREILTNFDITTPQFNALLHLIYHGSLTIGELGEKMYLACSTATDLIDRMERNGLVARERDKNDRRVVRLKVLERGHKMVDEVMAARINYLSGILEQVDESDRAQMIESMQLLHELMTGEKVKGS